MILNTLLCWIYLQIHFLGFPRFWKRKKLTPEEEKADTDIHESIKQAIKEKYDDLGDIRFHEMGVLLLFLVMVFLWVFKDPQFIPGWDSLPFLVHKTSSGRSFIKESTPTFLICVLLFAIPGKTSYYKEYRSGGK